MVNIHDAKTQFSKLLTRVSCGEEIIIAKAGRPIARLVPIVKRPKKRIAGTAKGKIPVAEDFDSPLLETVLDTVEQ